MATSMLAAAAAVVPTTLVELVATRVLSVLFRPEVVPQAQPPLPDRSLRPEAAVVPELTTTVAAARWVVAGVLAAAAAVFRTMAPVAAVCMAAQQVLITITVEPMAAA